MYFHYFVIISPWKRAESIIWTKLYPFTQVSYVPILVVIGRVVLEKKMKMWKVYGETDKTARRRTTGDQKCHLSFQLRWAKSNWQKLSSFCLSKPSAYHWKHQFSIHYSNCKMDFEKFNIFHVCWMQACSIRPRIYFFKSIIYAVIFYVLMKKDTFGSDRFPNLFF